MLGSGNETRRPPAGAERNNREVIEVSMVAKNAIAGATVAKKPKVLTEEALL
jgi:hypothetical protein